ncbi:MAG: hypothetical protein IV109_03265 [Rhodoferax sp.]|nr:hypothetical protein [Rhodoferax sp.]
MTHLSQFLGTWVILLPIVLLGGTAAAQPGPGAGADAAAPRPTVAASAPAGQRGETKGRRSAAWWGKDVTPGWAMMSWAERNEHRKKMRAMKSYEECKSYLDQHHELMAARAKDKGNASLMQPRRDACERLKP